MNLQGKPQSALFYNSDGLHLDVLKLSLYRDIGHFNITHFNDLEVIQTS